MDGRVEVLEEMLLLLELGRADAVDPVLLGAVVVHGVVAGVAWNEGPVTCLAACRWST